MTRLPRPGWSITLALLLFGAIVGTNEILQGFLPEPEHPHERSACTLHRMTGVPCPGCGSTRAVKAAARFDLLASIRHNPLVSIGLLLVGITLILRAVTGHVLRFELTHTTWVVVAVLVVVLFFANWWWVLRQHGFLLGSS